MGAVYVGWAGQGEGLGATQLGGQLGFGVRLLDGRLTIRPEIGAGLLVDEGYDAIADAGTGPTTTGATLSGGGLYLEPGVAAFVPLGTHGFFVGADANVLILPRGATNDYPDYARVTAVGVTMHAQIGLRF